MLFFHSSKIFLSAEFLLLVYGVGALAYSFGLSAPSSYWEKGNHQPFLMSFPLLRAARKLFLFVGMLSPAAIALMLDGLFEAGIIAVAMLIWGWSIAAVLIGVASNWVNENLIETRAMRDAVENENSEFLRYDQQIPLRGVHFLGGIVAVPAALYLLITNHSIF